MVGYDLRFLQFLRKMEGRRYKTSLVIIYTFTVIRRGLFCKLLTRVTNGRSKISNFIFKTLYVWEQGTLEWSVRLNSPLR
jgi:hypothetical protein